MSNLLQNSQPCKALVKFYRKVKPYRKAQQQSPTRVTFQQSPLGNREVLWNISLWESSTIKFYRRTLSENLIIKIYKEALEKSLIHEPCRGFPITKPHNKILLETSIATPYNSALQQSPEEKTNKKSFISKPCSQTSIQNLYRKPHEEDL